MSDENKGTNELAAALAKAQGAYKPIIKNCTGKVSYQGRDGKPGGSYEFDYADLQSIIEATREALSANGLSHTATIDDGRLTVSLMHASGQSISSSLPLPNPLDAWQKFGSAVTYGRRYLLAPMLGVASEDDDDANVAEGNHLQKTTRQPTPKADKPAERPSEEQQKKNAKVQALAIAVKEAGIPDDERLPWMGIELGKEVKSSKDLSIEEIDKLFLALAKRKESAK